MSLGTVGIVGLGLMGGSLALALREARPELTLLGCDRDERACRLAMERGAVALAGPDLDAVRAADVVVLAVPVPAMRPILRELSRTPLVTDVGSTKAAVVAWAAEAGTEFVGGHPMCGLEVAGFEAARADIYRGAPWVLSRAHPVIEELVAAVGARPIVIEPARHDHLVAGVSHSAFLLSAAYVLALGADADWPEMSRLAAGGYRDMSRLAGGDPDVYAGIAATNQEQILRSLDAVEAALARVRRHLEQADPRLVELFEEARAIRRRWEADHGRPG